MDVTEKENIKILKFSQGDIKEIGNSIIVGYDAFLDFHLIIDIREIGNTTLNHVLQLLPLSDKHRKNKKSVVIVVRDFDFNEVPEELNVVPTIQEAHDIIEMEEIERDLGF